MLIMKRYSNSIFSQKVTEDESVIVWWSQKKYVFENCVFIGKLSFGKPRLTHICGTLGSRTPFPFAVETFYS